MSKAAAPDEPDLLHRREQELDARVRPPLLHDPPRRLDHHGQRRLVVGAEDRPARVADDAVLAHDRLELAVEGDGVEVRAQEDRHAPVGAPGQPAEDVARGRADRRAGAVLVPLEPHRVELARDPVRDGPLLPGGLGMAQSSMKRSRTRLTPTVRLRRRRTIVRVTAPARRRRARGRAEPAGWDAT